jgi:hypothetical protein
VGRGGVIQALYMTVLYLLYYDLEICDLCREAPKTPKIFICHVCVFDSSPPPKNTTTTFKPRRIFANGLNILMPSQNHKILTELVAMMNLKTKNPNKSK